ncbi:unnamed protein product [Victoria cruziana]
MANLSFGFVLPLLLLLGSLLNWSLISFVSLLAFLVILYVGPRRGIHSRLVSLVLLIVFIFSAVTLLAETMFYAIWMIMGKEWSLSHSWWAKLIGFVRLEPAKSPGIIVYLFVIQLVVAVISFFEVRRIRFGDEILEGSCCWGTNLFMHSIGSRLRVTCCLLLPPVQLVVGIARPSWVSLPFFLCSCIGLVHWSLSSSLLGLFWCWRPLLLYSVFNIVMLYIFQLPIQLPKIAHVLADFLGFYKATASSEWLEILSGISLLLFYVMLSGAKQDLEEMDFIMSMQESSLSEQLLPSRHSFFIKQSRSGVKHTNVFLRGSIFRNFSINFFTYGFPVSLLALSFWSFNFASLCAFGLVAYVGYILYAFPSLFRLHRLNGLLLVFILLWAASTYVFNVAFTLLNHKLRKDMEIWETVGLWHYPIPGFFLLAQFCLGILVAMGNLVNNSVFLYLSDGDAQASSDDSTVGEKEETKVLFVATIAWGLRKCSRAITLFLIFLLAMKPGFIHSIYTIFFLVYILSHSISKKVRQSLILLCETHFALLYILNLNMISKALKHRGSVITEILSQLGLLDGASALDFFKIVVLLCFCAIQNHGFKMLFSFSAILQHTSHPPIGFSILKAGLSKSVLLSVYSSPTARDSQFCSFSFPHEKWVATYLSAIGERFLSTYRSYGTYIALVTILLTVYLVIPNYISFGYIFFLQFWIIGRQLVEKTRRRLWLPLKAYSILVFVFTYSLSIFPSFQLWISRIVNLYPQLGYDPKASLLENVWQSLAVLIVMQLYSYERRQSRYHDKSVGSYLHEISVIGFLKRLLARHSEKILSISVLYASLSPISAFSFIYLLALVICSVLPKASPIPSKFFLVYTGTLVTFEYLFQMWGGDAEMFPGQEHANLSVFLGLRVFSSGFWGIEAGLRGKVLVIVACTLQYNVFHWIKKMPSTLKNSGMWDDPCHLFILRENTAASTSVSSTEKHSSDSFPTPANKRASSFSSWPCFVSPRNQDSGPMHVDIGSLDGQARSFSYGSVDGSSRESHQWHRKSIHVLRNARFDIQMKTLRTFTQYWTENVFNLFGLEINMIVLLLASFAVLNAISLFYILCLVACILLSRRLIHKLWPIFFLLFATILIIEYFAMWYHLMPWNQVIPSKENICCHDCWSKFNANFDYCRSCWLGTIVDDPKMLISYYLVFMFASFKLRADHLSNFNESHAYPQMVPHRSNPLVWGDLSFEIKSEWTIVDYMKLYSYCHFLDVVLCLILVTGTLEYDILHLGYLGFALVFFRMRLEILKEKNKIFKFLRMYNFAVIVLSLAYQSPFFGGTVVEKCEMVGFIYEIIGFYKYDYGFRITSRSALVEIIIFILVSAQSYIFRLREFAYVSQYLVAEQIDAIWRAKTKKATWRTAQLQHIRNLEEQKRQRNLQVEKMKAEMLNLQNQLDSINSPGKYNSACPEVQVGQQKHSLVYQRKVPKAPISVGQVNKQKELNHDGVSLNQSDDMSKSEISEAENKVPPRRNQIPDLDSSELLSSYSFGDSSFCEITEVDEKSENTIDTSNLKEKKKVSNKENPLISAVHFIGDGVSQVQSLGNQAVTNIVSFLNIENDESHSNENAEDVEYGEQAQGISGIPRHEHLDRTSSNLSSSENVMFGAQIGKILQYIWTKMQANNDAVCFFFFILVFLWNFSVLSMVYLGALFLYALCVNPGPGRAFWVIMLIYTEVNILVQYLYQIIIQHCALNFHPDLLSRLGFPTHRITSSFVVSTLPLFLVYISTLLQSSITAKDGDYAPVSGFKNFRRQLLYQDEMFLQYGLLERLKHLVLPVMNLLKIVRQSFSRYWGSLIHGSEAPPYFVQLSLKVDVPPDYEIQLDRIESGINKLLKAAHNERCDRKPFGTSHSYSHVRVQSVERSPESSDVILAVFEVMYASRLTECPATDWHTSLTPAADVASEILRAQAIGLVEESGFPYSIVSVIAGGKREIDLYAYIFGADMATFFLVAVLYQSAIKNNSKFLDVYQLEDQFPKEFVFVLMVLFFLIVLDRIIYLCSFSVAKVIFYLSNLVLFTYSVTEYAWYLELARQQGGGSALRAIYLTKAISLVLQALQIRYGIPHKSALYQQFLTSKVSHINYLGFRLYRALPFLYELRCVLDWSCTSTSLTMYDWLKMYSSGNPTNIANPVKDASVQVDIKTTAGRLTLYQTTLCEMLPWEDLQASGFALDRQGYLETYNVNDIQLICCQADASSVWSLPHPVQLKFMDSMDDMHIFFSWVLTRDRPRGKEVVQYRNPVYHLPDPSELKKLLNGTAKSVRISDLYPRYFRVTGSGEVRLFEEDVESVSGDLILNHGIMQWWSFHDANASVMEKFCRGLKGPSAIVVSEETPQGILGETLSKFSIWSLYLTFVLAVGRFIRLQCSDLRMRIPYENLPTCDRLLAICLNIYAARAEGELEVEEVLYWTLVKIYRSPHMLLEYTKRE